MTGLAADVLVVWLLVTAASAALLALVVAAQGVLGLVRRGAARRRTSRSRVPTGTPVSRAGGSPAPR